MYSLFDVLACVCSRNKVCLPTEVDFFSHVEYFRSKQIFQYDFEKDIMCDKLIVIDGQHREMWSPLGRLNQNFCRILEAKDEMLVALVTVLVAISSSGMAFKILFLC